MRKQQKCDVKCGNYRLLLESAWFPCKLRSTLIWFFRRHEQTFPYYPNSSNSQIKCEMLLQSIKIPLCCSFRNRPVFDTRAPAVFFVEIKFKRSLLIWREIKGTFRSFCYALAWNHFLLAAVSWICCSSIKKCFLAPVMKMNVESINRGCLFFITLCSSWKRRVFFLISSKCNAALFLNTHREWNAVEFNNTGRSRVECFFVIPLHNAFYDKRYDEVLGNHI